MGRAGHDRIVEHAATAADTVIDPAVRRREIAAFLFLSVVIWPFVAVAVVGGFGFLVWMSQLIMGPPGPPVH